MAQERPVTPEKQLLGLIESGPAKTHSVKAHAAKHHGMSFLSIGAWLGRASFLKDNFKKHFKKDYSELLNVRLLNNTLIVGIIILAVYFVSSVYASVAGMAKAAAGPRFAEQEVKEEIAGAQNVSILKNAVSYYLEKIKERDIFKIGSKSAPATKASPQAAAPKVIEEIQRLKLVGISWSKDPDAMIEDTAALKTFFVKRGQTIGRVKVEAIFKDKVVVSFEGQESELR